MTDSEARSILDAIRNLHRKRRPDWPAEFEELAGYNARVARGVRHMAEYEARMAEVQARFDAWSRPDGEPRAGEPRGGQGEQGKAGQAREHGGTSG